MLSLRQFYYNFSVCEKIFPPLLCGNYKFLYWDLVAVSDAEFSEQLGGSLRQEIIHFCELLNKADLFLEI